ncbi:MAG: hypothetical protein K0U39_09720 [Alphaproteobacteria bacterium]|nr:hypothetical protein [Alphaproteobacteria bacterium]
MASNKIQEGLTSFLKQTDDQLFETQAKYGKNVYRIAWVIEILAAFVGLFFAWTTAWYAYTTFDDITWVSAIGGALPFIIIAIMEPTKIFLASGLYHAKSIIWKSVFLGGLCLLIFVTFETIYNGLIQNNVNVTRGIQNINNQRNEISDELTDISNQISQYQHGNKNRELINQEFDTKIIERENNIVEQRANIRNDYSQQFANHNQIREQLFKEISSSFSGQLDRQLSALNIDIEKLERQKQTLLGDKKREEELIITEQEIAEKTQKRDELLQSNLSDDPEFQKLNEELKRMENRRNRAINNLDREFRAFQENNEQERLKKLQGVEDNLHACRLAFSGWLI